MKAADYRRVALEEGREFGRSIFDKEFHAAASYQMGLAPGGRMRQEIYEDPYGLAAWETNHSARCSVHLANSMTWRQVTGEQPPTVPPTATEYARAGLPWFDYYDESHRAVAGSDLLARLKSVFALGQSKGEVPLPENASVPATPVLPLGKGRRPRRVREEPGR